MTPQRAMTVLLALTATAGALIGLGVGLYLGRRGPGVPVPGHHDHQQQRGRLVVGGRDRLADDPDRVRDSVGLAPGPAARQGRRP